MVDMWLWPCALQNFRWPYTFIKEKGIQWIGLFCCDVFTAVAGMWMRTVVQQKSHRTYSSLYKNKVNENFNEFSNSISMCTRSLLICDWASEICEKHTRSLHSLTNYIPIFFVLPCTSFFVWCIHGSYYASLVRLCIFTVRSMHFSMIVIRLPKMYFTNGKCTLYACMLQVLQTQCMHIHAHTQWVCNVAESF